MPKDSAKLIIDSCVLPEVFEKVVEAKRLLASKSAKSTADAVRMCGISRGAFYKYKDHVFEYNSAAGRRIITVFAVLDDFPGVLLALIGVLYEKGANILTINQNIPVGGSATVSISINTEHLQTDLSGLLSLLGSVEGVRSVQSITGSEQ